MFPTYYSIKRNITMVKVTYWLLSRYTIVQSKCANITLHLHVITNERTKKTLPSKSVKCFKPKVTV